jgi:hypothetical protein
VIDTEIAETATVADASLDESDGPGREVPKTGCPLPAVGRGRIRKSGNFLNSAGAQKLIAMITDYWRAQGYDNVVISAYPISSDSTATFGLRSDLIGGVPPGWRGEPSVAQMLARGRAEAAERGQA